MNKDSPYADWRMFFIRSLLFAFAWAKPLWWVFYRLFLTISPSVPVDLRDATGIPPLREIFWRSFLIAIFFCFVVTGGLCYLEGTLYGTNPDRRYFVQDGWNIILYTIVCPIYVALCCSIISIAVHEWGTLADFADQKTLPVSITRSSVRVYAVFFVALLLCTFFITNFISDVLNPDSVTAQGARVYWFMRDLGDGRRTLNRVGYYYVALNFALLFTTALGVSCFLSLAAEVLRSGTADSVEKIDDFETLKLKLEPFTKSYILTKGLAAAYALNVAIWAYSPLGKTDNLLAAQVALTLVGVFFVAVPRQYIELKWFELWQASGQDFQYSDTRHWRIRGAASFLDAWFIASVMGMWGLDMAALVKRISDFLSSL
jgi:hypothetical protein